MPAGLDGNPNPVVTPQRSALLDTVAHSIIAGHLGRSLVAVDGRSGVGKSTFADELSAVIGAAGLPVVRSSIDSFHRPRMERMRLGPTSPKGYLHESHQLDLVKETLLAPFARGERRVLTAAFDEPTDTVDRRHTVVPSSAVLIVDGLFLLRRELRPWWTTSVLLHADERLDRRWLDFLLDELPLQATAAAALIDDRLARARWPRYRAGWQRYLDEAAPAAAATFVVDNDDLEHPSLA